MTLLTSPIRPTPRAPWAHRRLTLLRLVTNVVAVFDWPILTPPAAPVTDRPLPRSSPTATAQPWRHHGATEERGPWFTEVR
jgi:hypothetical protein